MFMWSDIGEFLKAVSRLIVQRSTHCRSLTYGELLRIQACTPAASEPRAIGTPITRITTVQPSVPLQWVSFGQQRNQRGKKSGFRTVMYLSKPTGCSLCGSASNMLDEDRCITGGVMLTGQRNISPYSANLLVLGLHSSLVLMYSVICLLTA